MALSRFFRNFQLCLNAGVPIDQTCEIAVDGIGNGVIARWFIGGIQAVKDGKDVSEGFSRFVPLNIVVSWKNGEVTGDRDIVCDRFANQSVEESEAMLKLVAKGFTWLVYGLVAMVIIYFIFTLGSGYMQQIDPLLEDL